MEKKSIIYSTLMLTFASVITRLIGFVYRIYMSNELGAYGVGLYQLVMPVYMLSWSLICSGFTIAISKLVSQEFAKNNRGNMQKILYIGTFISFCLSIIVALVLYNFSSYIALQFFDTLEITNAFKILSFSLPFMSLGSCIRGYFLGLQQPVVPSTAQVLEQITRVGSIFLFIHIFGIFTIEVAILGILFAEAISTIYIVFSYKRFKTKHNINQLKSSMTTYETLNILLVMALPIIANRVVSSFLSTYENILITQQLGAYGLSKETALISLGSATGMAMPLIFFPTALITSIAISLMPLISSNMALKKYEKVKYLINKTLLFTSIMGFGVAMLFMVFGYEISSIIYNQNLRIELFALSISAPLIYIQMILSSTLNGLGLQLYTFINSVISSIIALLIIYFTMPTLGMFSFYIAIFCSHLFTVISNSKKIYDKTHLKINILDIIIKPFIVALSTGLTVNLIYNNIKIGNEILNLIIFGLFMCLIYFILCIFVGIIRIKDLQQIFSYIKPKVNIEKNE